MIYMYDGRTPFPVVVTLAVLLLIGCIGTSVRILPCGNTASALQYRRQQQQHTEEVAVSASNAVKQPTTSSASDPAGILCSHSGSSDGPPAPWDWRQRIGIASSGSSGQISFKELVVSLLPPGKRTNVAVNIGARDGVDHDPVYSLLKDLHYGALAFEGDKSILSTLRVNMAAVNASNNVHVIEGFVSSASVLADLKAYNVPRDVDVLKIDIDSFDMAIAKAVLNAGYEPKFVMMEINPDIPPPFQWYLDETPAFQFSNALVGQGLYGASGDAVLELLVKHKYRLLELELVDPNSSCPRCEHNMWFVHDNVIKHMPNLLHPVSYDEYVALFWSRNPVCLHVNAAYCPVAQIPKAFPGMAPSAASLAMLKPSHSARAYKLLGALAGGMESLCSACNMHMQVSQVAGCQT